MQEQNVITREEAAKYGLRPILGFSSTKQLRQAYADGRPVHTFHVAVLFPSTAKPKAACHESVF